jgi:predicted ATPase
MALRGSKLIAFDGTHASGKTTLLYAVAAQLRRAGLHVVPLPEPARASPFVDDVVIHRAGEFDMSLELDIFAAHLTSCLRAARGHPVVLADKTPTNVLAYARVVVEVAPESWDAAMLGAMAHFCEAWGAAYDAVLYCQDRYDPEQVGDRYRASVVDLQSEIDEAIRAEYQRLNQQLLLVPVGLDLAERVEWVLAQLRAIELIV